MEAAGSPIRPEQLPTSLPGYLIRLKAQISVDGQPQATSATPLVMGTELSSLGGFTQAGDPTQWDLSRETSNVVGQATAIGISAGGISAYQLDQLRSRLQQTQSQLQAAQSNPGNATALLASLTGEQISGDLLTATLWSWFAASESHNRLSQKQAGMLETPGLSYGLFHAVAQPTYSWGIIRQVKFPGVNMDIGHVRNLSWASDNDSAKWIAYNRLRGQYMSALEHAIPERFFNDPAKCNPSGTTTPVSGLPDCPQGVSAVKALATAAAQGQKIYTITRQIYQNNPGIVSSNLYSLSANTQRDIQNALDAGYEVTVHEAPITLSGWTGAGYTFIDPETGAGGYIIDGGSNGSFKERLESDVGGKLLNFFNTEKPPEAFYTNPFLITISVVNLAVYSAIDTVQELWNCHAQQIGDAVLSILLFLAAAAILAALTAGTGLGAALAVGLLILGGTTVANAAPQNRPTCGPAKMRVQFQVSPYCNNPGGNTIFTYGEPVEQTNRSLGVTTRQVRDKMGEMFAAKPSQIPNGVDLRGMIVYISERLKRYPPLGEDRVGNIERAEQFYNGLCYRVDLENLVARNLKE